MEEKETQAEEVKNEEVKQETNNINEETKKDSSKKIVIITLVTLFVVIAAGIGGFLAYNYIEENKSVGTDWGDVYYNYLEEGLTATDSQEQSKYGIIDKENMENTTIQFVNLDQQEEPEMIMNYTINGEYYSNIYYKKEDNSIGTTTYAAKEDIQLLYNIEKQEYIYYAHSVSSDGKDQYISMPERLEELKKTEPDDTKIPTTYTFEESDMPKENEEVKEGEVPTITKFEETFIVPVVGEIEIINIDLNADTKEIKKVVTETIKEYKTEEQVITEEVKTGVEEDKTELENKKEEIRKAEEAKKKAEEEAKKKAEEEAKKKAAEEAKKGLKVGNNTLKYGKYTFYMDYGNGEKLSGTITLQPNGKFHIKSNFDESTGSVGSGLNCNGTYTVEYNVPSGSPGDYMDGIRFKTSTGKTFFHEVYSNNAFSDQWHQYTYAGN